MMCRVAVGSRNDPHDPTSTADMANSRTVTKKMMQRASRRDSLRRDDRMKICAQKFLTAALLALALLVIGCWSGQSGREKGVREATAAIAAGQLKLKEYPPLPYPPGHLEYVKLLRERCGVEYEVPKLPSGVSKDVFIQEVRGWNDTMKAEIRRQFGANVFSELEEAARKQWKSEVPAKGAG